MLKGVSAHRHWFGQRRLDPGRKIEQCLCGFGRQVSDNLKDCVLGGYAHVGKPFGRNAISKKLAIGDVLEDWRLGRSRMLNLYILRNLLHALANLYQLRSAGFWMSLQPPPFGPVVGLVVVVYVAKKQAGSGSVDD